MGAISPLIAVTCVTFQGCVTFMSLSIAKAQTIHKQVVAAVLQCMQFGNHFLVRMPLWASC